MFAVLESAEKRDSGDALFARYAYERAYTLALCRTLKPEDCVVQSMPDVSPTKWHLAHVTWFFERFVVKKYVPDYVEYDPQYDYLFNSYYYTAGDMHKRPLRGLLSRPTLAEIKNYRAYVDSAMGRLIDGREGDAEFKALVELGLQHEQQHQELLVTDIKHVLSQNPVRPAVYPELIQPPSQPPAEHRFESGPEGIRTIGAEGAGFAFDNETPRHDVLLAPHSIGSRLVTNAEYGEFVDDGGYRDPTLWLSDGWTAVNERGWDRPLYWSADFESEYTLGGVRDIDPHAPVAHVSYYEADAYARWAGARLPTEAEWETRAASEDVTGNFGDAGYWHPAAADDGRSQLYGDTWEWTSSPYVAYPGYRPLAGSLGEYNGKFMCGQMSVRGGSCASSRDHLRASYRSFFYPDARWQFLGIRLAKDGA